MYYLVYLNNTTTNLRYTVNSTMYMYIKEQFFCFPE